jgi:adenylyltransferase/sulfurtransferase
VGVIASIQTAEALKFLAGHPEKMSRDLVSVDVWEGRFDRLRADRPVPGCPACGERRFDWLEGEAASSTTTLCGRRSVQVLPAGRARVDLETLAGRLAPLGDVTVNRFLIRVRVEGHELTVFADGRAIVGETTDPSVARALYARYVGL